MPNKYFDRTLQLLVKTMQHSNKYYVADVIMPELKLLLNEMAAETTRRKHVVINWKRRCNHVNSH